MSCRVSVSYSIKIVGDVGVGVRVWELKDAHTIRSRTVATGTGYRYTGYRQYPGGTRVLFMRAERE